MRYMKRELEQGDRDRMGNLIPTQLSQGQEPRSQPFFNKVLTNEDMISGHNRRHQGVC